MKDSLLPFLCCPVSRSPLQIEAADRHGESGEILSGTLRSSEGRIYLIDGGIPHLGLTFRSADEAQTVRAFGQEWARYDDFEGFMGSGDLFTSFTGLTEKQVRDKTVLEVGCGAGRWLKTLAALGAREVVGLDFSSAVVQAARRTTGLSHVHVVRGSALDMPLAPMFDLVVSIGVIHHLDDPIAGLAGIRKAVVNPHLVAIWVYAAEGNELYLRLVKPLRWLGPKLPQAALVALSRGLASILWAYVHTVNPLATRAGLRLPLRDYLSMLRRLRYCDLESVVYDQLTPSIARYPTKSEVRDWVGQAGGKIEHLYHARQNSWQCHFQFGF